MVADSVVAAKTHARSLQQRYPLQAKKYKLSNTKVLIWAVFWGGVEVGIQFTGLIFARVSVSRNLCVYDHAPIGLLIYHAPLIAKALVIALGARWALQSRIIGTFENESHLVNVSVSGICVCASNAARLLSVAL